MPSESGFVASLPKGDPLFWRQISVGGGAFFWATKRVFDLVVSIMLLPALGLIAIALLVLNPLYNKGPLFFVQVRMGKQCIPFRAVKFRSMVPTTINTRGANDSLETHRITPLGALLRMTRIDELPQILNVLVGDMSLIGPRPDFFDHAQEFISLVPRYRERHVVRPGISGFAQVTLGYAEGFDATHAKASADWAYVRNAGYVLEMRILWQTLVTVSMRRGR